MTTDYRTTSVLPAHWRHAYRCAYKWARETGVRYEVRWDGDYWIVQPA